MDSDSGRTTSVWMRTVDMPAFSTLDRDLQTDVCVVGAGIAGLMTAYLLVRAGRRVVVLEDGTVGAGETGRTTAHLSNAFDDRYFRIEDELGLERSQQVASSHTSAIHRLESICREESIDCDFLRVDGYLFLAPEHDRELLERELAAAHRAGLADVRMLERAPTPGMDTGICLQYPGQGQFHPLEFLRGLAEAIVRRGGQIYTGSHVNEIRGGAPVMIGDTKGHKVTAQAAVIATNSPISDMFAVHTKQFPYRTYVVGARIPKGSLEPILLWDTGDPYHYVRLQPMQDHDVLIVGGEDHKTGEADDGGERFARLEAWTRGRFPMLERFEYRWSGQVFEPMDGVAFIGKDPGQDLENVYIATGDSGQGMTHGAIAGMLLTDLIVGRENDWAALYDPRRITLDRSAVKEFVLENLKVAKEYARDWLVPADEVTVIEPGSGAVIRRDGQQIAAFRDDEGILHERSAVCTHLGCIVHWNSTKRIWNCPCHGSRFGSMGDVLNGPASAPLEPIEES